MSYVNVTYHLRTIKVPVTPSTQLGEIRDAACAKGLFNLRAEDYTLSRQGKNIDLTLPFRFANLVNNAQLELVSLPKVSKEQQVRVKIRVPNGKDYIGQFSGGSDVQTVLATANLKGKLVLGAVEVNPESQLASLGGNGLLFTLKPPTAPTASNTTTASKAANQVDSVAKTNDKPTSDPELGKSAASTGSKLGVPTSSKSDIHGSPVGSDTHDSRMTIVTTKDQAVSIDHDDPSEMSQTQFLTYYNHLKSQAEPAMISKATSERLRAESRPPVTTTTVRIKFPDQSTLAGKFEAGESGSAVYQYVKSYLRDPNQPFTLESMKPRFTLETSAELPGQLGSRALLVFTSKTTKTPILNDKALSMARQAEPQAPSPKEPASKGEDKPQKEPKSMKSKLTPKWLKLHK